ncbi:MAG TPA: hypothetical protein PLY36_05695 [Spirochaetota bacterium]|nr:hypothetical protein [Spirochaetota bacterium]
MSRKYINFFLVPAFILLASVSIYTQIDPGKDTIIFNSVNIKTETGETAAESVDFKAASEWAYNSHLTLVPDAPPVIDNKAFLITQYQTVIPVTGYNKDLFYRVYIDFFRYSQPKVPFNTKLKIIIRDIDGKRREIGTADVTYMSDKKIFEVSIPFDLSYRGKFDIIIHEYSGKTGNWGIWDIIVTSKKINEIEIMPIDSTEKIKEIEPKIFK